MKYVQRLIRFFRFNTSSWNNVPIDHSGFPNVYQHKRKIAAWLTDTPLFLIDRLVVHERLKKLHRALQVYWPGNSAVAYSLKTNYELVRKRVVTHKHVWAEATSLALVIPRSKPYMRIFC